MNEKKPIANIINTVLLIVLLLQNIKNPSAHEATMQSKLIIVEELNAIFII